MKKIIRYIKKLIYYFIRLLFNLNIFKINNKKIVFDNFNGKGFGCNPKYIALELIKEKVDCKMIWFVNEYYNDIPENIKQIKRNSFKFYYHLSTAKIIIDNVKNYNGLRKKKNQVYIQTWHASYSPKLLENDAKDKINKKYLNESMLDSKDIDIFLSNSNLQTEEYKKNFWCESLILEAGYPRNDIFFNYDNKLIESIKNKLCIKNHKKIVLYTPTFRDDNSKECYNIDYQSILDILNKKNNNWIFLIRMHPNVNDYKSLFRFNKENIIDVTNYPDIQELLLISDILITDYSTTMFDFLILNKPIFIYANDIEKYQKIRGLKDFFFELPFPLARNNDEIVSLIKNFDKDKYNTSIDKFEKVFSCYDKGIASNEVVKIIKNIFNNKTIKGGI